MRTAQAARPIGIGACRFLRCTFKKLFDPELIPHKLKNVREKFVNKNQIDFLLRVSRVKAFSKKVPKMKLTSLSEAGRSLEFLLLEYCDFWSAFSEAFLLPIDVGVRGAPPPTMVLSLLMV